MYTYFGFFKLGNIFSPQQRPTFWHIYGLIFKRLRSKLVNMIIGVICDRSGFFFIFQSVNIRDYCFMMAVFFSFLGCPIQIFSTEHQLLQHFLKDLHPSSQNKENSSIIQFLNKSSCHFYVFVKQKWIQTFVVK